MDDSHQPTFHAYGLTPSVYRDYEETKNELTRLQKSLEVPSWILYTFFAIASVAVLFMFNCPWYVSLLLGAYFGMILVGALGDWLSNLISGGKIKKTEEKIRLLDQSIKEKVRPFEQACKAYFEAKLREFYETNLFRKRSGNERFESNLAHFSSMLDELDEANGVFITTKLNLGEYQSYVWGRVLSSTFKREPHEANFSELKKLSTSRSVPGVPAPAPIHPPEKLYSTVRVIDWDELNKARKVTGLKGEEIALWLEKDYLVSVHREDLSMKVSHVSLEGDGHGYDILSYTADGEEKYIEVKSTSRMTETPFYMSSNELGFLQRNAERAYIYRVANVNENENPTLKIYPAKEVLESSSIIPTQYVVKMNP